MSLLIFYSGDACNSVTSVTFKNKAHAISANSGGHGGVIWEVKSIVGISIPQVALHQASHCMVRKDAIHIVIVMMVQKFS